MTISQGNDCHFTTMSGYKQKSSLPPGCFTGENGFFGMRYAGRAPVPEERAAVSFIDPHHMLLVMLKQS
jgi:hypothetical protein